MKRNETKWLHPTVIELLRCLRQEHDRFGNPENPGLGIRSIKVWINLNAYHDIWVDADMPLLSNRTKRILELVEKELENCKKCKAKESCDKMMNERNQGFCEIWKLKKAWIGEKGN